jgi:DNA-binding SARP family transcriptional activator/tetratricopeptide (TPR) repeat protein
MLRLRVLGGLALETRAAHVSGTAAQRKPLALLALLTVARKTGLSRETIGAYLWPEAEAGKVSHRLNQLLYALRRDLGREDLFLGLTDLRLNPDVISSDLAEFMDALDRATLEEAISAYAGPFLDGFHLGDAPEFERWVDTKRAELTRQYGTALEALGSEAMRRGDGREAAEWWRRRADLDPLDPRLALRLMEALHQAGDARGALCVADEYSGVVNEELGTGPDPSVLRLAAEIRQSSASTARGSDADAGSDAHGIAQSVAEPPVAEAVPDSSEQNPTPVWRISRSSRSQLVAGALFGAFLLGLLLVALRSQAPRLDPRLVVVVPLENRSGDEALDVLGPIASDWITRVLSESHLVDVADLSTAFIGSPPPPPTASDSAVTSSRFQAADVLGAGTLITGSYYRQGDSLYFQATVIDRIAKKILASPGPLGAPDTQPLPAIEQLRQRVAAALAIHLDPQLKELSALSKPPTYESYRHYVEGNRLAMLGEYRRALGRYAEATAEDSTFHAPLVFQALVHFDLGLTGNPEGYQIADSLAKELNAYRDQLTTVENLLLDWLVARLGGYSQTALQVSRRMAHLLPGTPMQYMAGFDAYLANRPHEAVRLLRSMDPNRGLMHFGSIYYWWVLTSSYHVLGRHREELTAAEAAMRSYGPTWDVLYLEMRALAALHRVPELKERLDQSVGLAPNFSLLPPGLVLVRVARELRAHGSPEEAHRGFTRALAWYRDQPPPDSDGRRTGLGHALYHSGDWTGARRAFAQLAAKNSTDWRSRAMLGLTAARLGDSAGAARIMDTLTLVHGPFLFGQVSYYQACIASVLGHREEAVAFLRRAFAEGLLFREELHTDPDLESLRGFGPFQQLLEPGD